MTGSFDHAGIHLTPVASAPGGHDTCDGAGVGAVAYQFVDATVDVLFAWAAGSVEVPGAQHDGDFAHPSL